jgi:hypothetical protein
MAKYKKYDYKQMVMLPISLEDQLAPGTLEFAIHLSLSYKNRLQIESSYTENKAFLMPLILDC